jgi:molecular chaperone GrpE
VIRRTDAMDNDDTRDTNPDGPVKVVDRRWWTHGDTGVTAEAGRPRKPSYLEDLEQQLAEKDKAIQAHAQRYRDSATEFEQVRARLRRDVDKEVDRARRALLDDLLDVADNLDRAIAAAVSGPADPGLLRGVQLVRDLFLSRLASYGVTPFAAEGAPFDPHRHEAVSIVPVADPAHDDHVVHVIRAGYAIGEDVLRPATVAVGRVAS